MKKYWWPIYEIRFTKAQMRFLIDNIESLRIGNYPQQPSGYTDAAVKPQRYREPPSNKVIELAAEVDCRLDLIIDYISGWKRPIRKIRKANKGHIEER